MHLYHYKELERKVNTVEPRFTDTCLIRTPQYYGQFCWSRQMYEATWFGISRETRGRGVIGQIPSMGGYKYFLELFYVRDSHINMKVFISNLLLFSLFLAHGCPPKQVSLVTIFQFYSSHIDWPTCIYDHKPASSQILELFENSIVGN